MKRWVISDTHFRHQGIYSFLRPNGDKVRPWNNAVEADEAMIRNWNSVVAPEDKVYHVGDVAMSKNGVRLLSGCNGTKILIAGNHDREKLSFYAQFFKDVRGAYNYKNILLTHIPVHGGSKARFLKNVHGHLHANKIDDPWYINVCVEQINYTPISLDKIVSDATGDKAVRATKQNK